eukprot:500581_1
MSSSFIHHYELGAPETKRWYILIVFSLISAFQTNTWFMFASIPNQVEDYYNLHKSASGQVSPTISLLLNWCPIMFVPFAPITGYLLSYPIIGLKYTIILASILVFLGTFVCCIPTILVETSIYNNPYGFKSIIFLHIGEIINAIANPLVMSVPSKLSAIWFASNQRTFATGISAASNTFGNCIAFLMGPLLVRQAHNFPKFLYLNLVLSFIPFVCCFTYFPCAPNKLPSIVAKNALLSQDITTGKSAALIENQDQPIINENDDIVYTPKLCEHFVHFMKEMKKLFTNKSAFILIFVGGMQSGIFAAWTSVLQDMLSPMGLNDTDIGFIGFNISFIAMSGGLIGYIADKCFVEKLKKFINILFVFNILFLMLLFFILPSPFNDNSIIFTECKGNCILILLNVMIGLMAFCEEGLLPLFYELSAEISYPVSEGSCGMLLSLINNIAALIFIFIASAMNTKYETFLALIVAVICIVLITVVKEEYKRNKD